MKTIELMMTMGRTLTLISSLCQNADAIAVGDENYDDDDVDESMIRRQCAPMMMMTMMTMMMMTM